VIKLLAKIPQNVEVACSGGVDSMAVCDFLEQMRIGYRPIFFNHDTATSNKAETFLRDKFRDGLLVGRIKEKKSKHQSWEEYWRIQRNQYFKSRNSIIVTGHHLDDAVETWIWSALHGQPKIPLYYNGLVYRPFLLNRKAELINWAKNHDVKWIEDESNKDTKFQRNYIRKELIPHALKINPGIHKVVARKIRQNFSEYNPQGAAL
jgi:tRNA(Ile)-lysidine synthase